MGARSLSQSGASVVVMAALTGCGPRTTATTTTTTTTATIATSVPTTLPDRIAADFEHAVTTGKDAFVDLFDFEAVGEYEILLHRYDLWGRQPLSEAETASITAEDGTPYPPARERRNVGNYYPRWVSASVGTGGCAIGTPRTKYGQQLARIEALHADAPPGYQALHDHAAAWVAAGGVVGIRCTGGTGGVAVVWTKAPNPRGYNLITIYKD